MILWGSGHNTPYFFIQDYARQVPGRNPETAFWTLTTINEASIFGRVMQGLIVDVYNNLVLVVTLFTLATTILTLCWIAIR